MILVVLWIEFLAYRLLTAPIADLLSAPEIPVTSMWALMALILMAGIASPHSAGHCLDAVGADGCRLEGLSLLILFGSRPDIGRGVFLDFSRRALII